MKSTVKFRQPPQRTLAVEGVRVVEVKASHPLLENPQIIVMMTKMPLT